MAEQLTTFASGAQSSGDVARFDLVPRVFLERVARRFGLGAKKYGDQAYRAGLADRAFILERMNHAQQHLQALMAPKNAEEWDDDNLAALGWFCAFMTEVEAHPEGKLILNVIREERGCEQPAVAKKTRWRKVHFVVEGVKLAAIAPKIDTRGSDDSEAVRNAVHNAKVRASLPKWPAPPAPKKKAKRRLWTSLC